MGDENLLPVAHPLKKCFETEFIVEGFQNNSTKNNIDSVYTDFADKSFLKGMPSKEIPTFLPSKIYAPEYTMTCPDISNGVEFFAKFENANLGKVYQVSNLEYELYLSEDYNTTGHFHWFYFKTRSHLPQNSVVEFKIVNMMKPTSLYTVGFRPFTYSVKKNVGWIQAGECISYNQNEPSTASTETTKRRFYTLKWKYTYEFENDEVYFAQFIPYTYSDLINYLRIIKDNEKNENIARIDMMCKTLAKNVCPMITITNNVGTYISYKYERRISSMSKSTMKILYNRMEKLMNKLKTKVKTGNISHKRKYKNELNLEQTEGPEFDTMKNFELESALLKHNEVHKKKKGIIIVARVHPGI